MNYPLTLKVSIFLLFSVFGLTSLAQSKLADAELQFRIRRCDSLNGCELLNNFKAVENLDCNELSKIVMYFQTGNGNILVDSVKMRVTAFIGADIVHFDSFSLNLSKDENAKLCVILTKRVAKILFLPYWVKTQDGQTVSNPKVFRESEVRLTVPRKTSTVKTGNSSITHRGWEHILTDSTTAAREVLYDRPAYGVEGDSIHLLYQGVEFNFRKQ